jgi:DNA modification methylase
MRIVRTAQDSEIRNALAVLAEEHHGANVADPPSFHPFPARMPVPLAEYLLRALVPVHANVLDPMAGSGSTLVAARGLGHTGHGVDIDPLAVLMSRSATASYQRHLLDGLGTRVLRRAEEVRAELPRTSVPKMLGSSEEEKQFINYWFPQNSQRQLYCLIQAIGEESELALRNVAWAAFSSLIIAKSTSVSYAIDIPRSRPHKDEDREIDPPFDLWIRRFTQVVKRLPFLDKKTEAAEPCIEQGDARYLRHASGSLDLILTSPPYLNAIDYIRGHKFSLLWMGHGLSSLRRTRSTMIGCERGMWKPNGLAPSMEKDLAEAIDEERIRAITRRYLSDLRYSLLEMKRVARPGGLITLVLGPCILDKEEPDSIDIARLLAKSANLRFVAGVLRPLKRARRSLPPPDAVSKKSELASRMSSEAIVVLRKKKSE